MGLGSELNCLPLVLPLVLEVVLMLLTTALGCPAMCHFVKVNKFTAKVTGFYQLSW